MIFTNSYCCFVPNSQLGLVGLTVLHAPSSPQCLMEKEPQLCLEPHTRMKELVPQVEISQSASPDWVDWEVFCDLLSGASWSEVCSQWFAEGLNRLAPEHLALLTTRLTARKQFQFTDSSGAIAPLEILWLKWRLIATVSDRVLRIHSETQHPLLNLHPSKFRILFPENCDPLLPARWQFILQSTDLVPATPLVPEGIPSGEHDTLFHPADGMGGIFQSPDIPRWPLGQSATSTVLIRSIERIRQDVPLHKTVQGLVRLHILEDSFPASEFSDKDTFRVSLPIINERMTSVIVWGQKVESAERGLVIAGKTEPTDAKTWECLESLQQEVWNHAEIFVYRSFHVPCDLYSLGVLSLYTFLGLKGSEGQRVEALLPDLIEAIHKIVKSLGTENEELLGARLGAFLKDSGGLFSKRALIFPGARTQQSGMLIVPDDLWDRILLFAFRLLTRIPGFSFCRHAGDYLVEYPQQLMENVMADVLKIGDELNGELFGFPQRNRDILSACQQLREERSKAN